MSEKEIKILRKKAKSNLHKETIFVFGAHSDDFVIGAGGTISKYALEGKRIISIVFSYGEKSHPWLKPEIVQKMRAKEAFRAGTELNSKIIFFDLEELKFYESYKNKNIAPEIIGLMNKYRPRKIFTHSEEDYHPDHKDTYKITLELLSNANLLHDVEVYTYSVWNPVSFKTTYPSLYVDITKTFSIKLKALKAFRSQKIQIIYPFFLLLFRAIKDGLKIRRLFGERFFRVK